VVMRLPIHNDAGAVIGAIGFALFDELRNLSPLIERYLSMQQELASTRSLLRSRQSKYNFAHFIGTIAGSIAGGAGTVNFSGTNIASNGSFQNATTTIKGQFYGTGAEAMAGIYNTGNTATSVAFGGKKQ